MQQRKQSANQSNGIKIDEPKRLQLRKSRSSSQTRITTNSNAVKNIVSSSKSVENGKYATEFTCNFQKHVISVW